jgi:hypothetical protein
MRNTNFQPIFEYMDHQFSEVHNSIGTLGRKVDTLQTSVDVLAKMTKNNSQEIIVINSRLERLGTKAA